MALDTAGFASGMEALLTDMENRTENAKGEARRLGGLITDLIKSGEIPPGLAVTTPVGPGSTTAPGKMI